MQGDPVNNSEQSASKGIRVLVVDDDYQDFLLVSEYLRQNRLTSYTVDHASTVVSAFAALLDDSYDVFLVDLVLGSDTGIQILEEATRARVNKPIIMLTGVMAEDADNVVMALGAADFIPKAEVTSSLLDRTIRHALERKASASALERLVKQDVLTGLGNRKMFEDHIEFALARARRNETCFAVMFLDLDRFKDINDSMGHHAGDALLIEVARRLKRAVRESDVVARIGGDEFTILLDEIHSDDDAERVASKLIESIALPVTVDGKALVVSACIGISFYPDSGSTVRELMQYADMALYEAKARGGDTWQLFTHDMQSELERNLSIESGLRDALQNDRLELRYQPLVDVKSGEIVGAEALVRWRHPDGNLVMPDEFLGIANKTGLIGPLGDWVIAKALQQLFEWQQQGFNLRLCVNISPRQLRSAIFLPVFEAMLKNCDVDVSHLEIELTEDAFSSSSNEIMGVLGRLRQLGVHISIDDFGIGYSSLGCLKKLPIDRLKIDRSFISGHGEYDSDSNEGIAEDAITQAIIVMAKSLRLKVVAEGVETERQLAFLRECGCDEAQGFYFSQPVDAQALTDFIRKN